MKKLIPMLAIMLAPRVVAASDLSDAINKARTECDFWGVVDAARSTASEAMTTSGVGTVAGGVALGAGIVKAKADKQIKANESGADESGVQPSVDDIDTPDTVDEIDVATNDTETTVDDMEKLAKKSKNAGLVQGGALGVAALSNLISLAGSSTIAGDKPLEWHIDGCVTAVKDLSNVKMTAFVAGTADETELQRADKIISACSKWETFDYSKIKKRATGAAISSGVGAVAGGVGVVTAFGGQLEDDDKKSEKHAKIANVSSGVTTAASGVATGFNAAQVKVINRAMEIAEECDAALWD